MEDLWIESIKLYGLEVLYLPRTLVNPDPIYGEDVLSQFAHKYPIEMYVKTIDFFEGEGDFLSKFGLETRNEISFNVAIRRFNEAVVSPHVTAAALDIKRPREGDLIWFPIDQRLFEISMVEKRSVFFQVGELFQYLIKCRQFEFTSEKIETTDNSIDIVEDDHAHAITIVMDSGFGTYIIGEDVTGTDFTAQVSEWNEDTKILKLIRPSGVLPTGNFTGAISGATYEISETEEPEIGSNEHVANNEDVQDSSVVVPMPNPITGG